MCEVAFVQDRQVNTDCTHATNPSGEVGRPWCYVEPQANGLRVPTVPARTCVPCPGGLVRRRLWSNVSWPLALMTWPSDREFFMKRMAEKPCALDARLTLAEQQCTGSAAACPRAILQGARSLCAGLYSVAGTVPRAKQCGRDLCQSVAACLCLIRAQTCSRWRA